MATFAARKLHDIADNVAAILSIELLAATQGVELRAPFSTSPQLILVVEKIRSLVAHYDIDHYLSPDIQEIIDLVNSGSLAEFCPLEVLR
ncbi:histidine ammonia-lyase [mine drainage metagenome]|uniref:Histidine ammonia-lyase n=1 Tax=mine drainage metagenome TaxID=410659 RepID=T1D9C2_9ZZZZ